MTDARCFVPSRAGMSRQECAELDALRVAILRCAGPRVWVTCRPNPHWGFRAWPGLVLRWRRTWAEVRFWCGPVEEVRQVHYSRLDPRSA